MFQILSRNRSFVSRIQTLKTLNCHISTNTTNHNDSKPEKIVKEKQLKNLKTFEGLDPESFGNYAQQFGSKYRVKIPLKSEQLEDDKDEYDEMFIKRGVKKSPDAYYRMLKEYLKEKPLNFAKIIAHHEEYIYEDRYIPEVKFYTLMFKACALVGNTPKAIELFNDLKLRNMKITQASITLLLNSCAHSSGSKEYSLKKLIELRDHLQLNGHQFNDIQYNCLIKSFAMLDDKKSALSTLTEMESKGYSPNKYTYSALLKGAINDHHAGLYYAREYFIKIISSGNQIDILPFNLFLRAVRDCQLESKHVEKIMKPKNNNETLFLDDAIFSQKKNMKLLAGKLKNQTSIKQKMASANNLPSLLTGAGLN